MKVKNFTQKKSIFEVGKNIAEQSKQALDNAKEITELTNKVKLAEAEQRKIQLTYQRDAELQRQLRDDTSASIDDRIAANEKLGRVLEEQFEKEKQHPTLGPKLQNGKQNIANRNRE